MANTKKRWTTEEIEILKKHYPTEGDAVFKRLPGRTAKSCRIQASKLKISKTFLLLLYRMTVSISDYGQRQKMKYSGNIMQKRAVMYVAV